jgi:hypothetical protein
MDPKTGPLFFMKEFMRIQHPTKGEMRFEPYPYQERLIESYNSHRFSIAMLPRQTGKTTCASGYLLWYAMFKPDSQILIAAHKYQGASDIMSRVRYAYEMLPSWIKAGVTQYNRNSIEFDNGSKIMATTTTENTGRGMSLSLIYCDEFAFVQPPEKAKEFWTSLSPTISTGGKCLITSTPNSDEDQFAYIWKGANKVEDEYGNPRPNGLGINGFKAFRAYWREHPERDDTWADEQRAQLGDERFRREMDCEFVINDETLISPIKLLELEGVEPLRKTGQVRWYKAIDPEKMYIVALDPSLGTGGDPAALQVFEAETTEQVAEWRHNRTDIPTQVRILADVVKEIHAVIKDNKRIYYSVENNTIGEAALISIAEYGEENIQGYFLSDNSVVGTSGRRFRKGFNTTNKAKLTACNKFKILVESGRMKIHSKPLISELKTFVADGVSYKAKPGETDDLVMSSLLVTRMLILLQSYHTELDAHLKDHSDNIIEPMPFISIMR